MYGAAKSVCMYGRNGAERLSILMSKSSSQEIHILVTADIHGATELLERALQEAAPVDLVVIAGDAGCDEAEIAAYLDQVPYILVPGNNDYDLLWDLPEVAAFSMGGLHFLVTHGHLQDVYDGITPALVDLARENGADVLIFGHSHKYLCEYREGILFPNPGAVIGDPDSMESTCQLVTIREDRSIDAEKILLLDLRDFLY